MARIVMVAVFALVCSWDGQMRHLRAEIYDFLWYPMETEGLGGYLSTWIGTSHKRRYFD